MKVEFVEFGAMLPDLNPERLLEDISKRAYNACAKNEKCFEIIELRQIKGESGNITDIIIVDCYNVRVPSRNGTGIKPKERLALVFPADRMPEVRALRKNFPIVPHTNDVPAGEPVSLCLYSEPWSALERTWTPEKHLQRILWWLEKTADGTLHAGDQPVEPIFFESPFEVVLPPDYEEKTAGGSYGLIFERVDLSPGKFKTLRGMILPKEKAGTGKAVNTKVLMMRLPPIVHGQIESLPHTLGQLDEQLERRGVSFIPILQKCIRDKTPPEGLNRDVDENCLLILTIPVKRDERFDPERLDRRGYAIGKCLARLGEETGALTLGAKNRCFYTPLIGAADDYGKAKEWRSIQLDPVSITVDVSKERARKLSAIEPATCNFKGVLAGVGALGGMLAEIWSNEAWGEWVFIDSDTLKPHNVIRHVAKNEHIGRYKVEAVKKAVEMNFPFGHYSATAVPDSVTSFDSKEVAHALDSAELLVDATTTLEAPRDLSRRNNIPRSVSVFLTPSGNGSVLLMESGDRTTRLSSLEAQYYRAVIESSWGSDHLKENLSGMWVGAGCRDVSAVLSYDAVQLHAAILARQVRLLKDDSCSRIRVWTSDLANGSVDFYDIPVMAPACAESGGWIVNYDSGIQEKLGRMRREHTPAETGGVLVGYIDQKLKTIFIVDALPAPSDSVGDSTGFIRGVSGLEAAVEEIRKRTAMIVGYIGEWHSHPPLTGATPSPTDRILVKTLAEALAVDGQPFLMIIVAAGGEISVTVKQGI